MMARFAWIFALLGLLARLTTADFTYTGSPVAGQPFTITWTGGPSTIDVLLYFLTGSPPYVPTTSIPLAMGIENSGSYVWNVPADEAGLFSFSIAANYRTPLFYSPHFALGGYSFETVDTTTYTEVPQTTECTSAAPAPTGPNPFLTPNDARLRIGVAFAIQWQPTTSGTVSLILNPSVSNSYTVASAPILSNIPNVGSFTWTPPNDGTLDSNGGWYLTLVDDATQATSTSDSFNILSPTDLNSFNGPFAPLVAGQDYIFNWSPSTTPTISILIELDEPYGWNKTLASRIKNTGTFTWPVPSSDPSITPGAWAFSIVDDATGNEDSTVFLTIDPTTPPLCGPQTTDSVDAQIASWEYSLTKDDGGYTQATPTTTDASLLSILASYSSANAAKVTKVTPHVLTTLGPSTSGSVGQFLENQSGTGSGSGSVLSSTSRAGAVDGRVGMGGRISGSSGVWEISSGIFGLFIGILGVVL